MKELWSKAQTKQAIINRSGTKFNSALDMDLAMRDAETRLQSGGGLLGKGGLSFDNILGGGTGGQFDNNAQVSSNMSVNVFLWRGALETISFMPLSSADPVGGTIITDWYSENSNNLESIKITIRFLSNEIRSDSMKIILHKKVCNNDLKCNTNLVSSSLIKDELRSTILRKASLLQKTDKRKK